MGVRICKRAADRLHAAGRRFGRCGWCRGGLSLVAGPGVALTATITSFRFEYLAPYLQRGTDKGDYVLPGNAATYPTGGSHARYYNDSDLASLPQPLSTVLNPTRSVAYGGQSLRST